MHKYLFIIYSLFYICYGAAMAAEINVTGTPCHSKLQLIVKEEKLSSVLKQLAEKFGFELKFDLSIDETISYNNTLSVTDTVKKLTRFKNVVILKNKNSECPDTPQLKNVWLLPKGENSSNLLLVERSLNSSPQKIHQSRQTILQQTYGEPGEQKPRALMTPEERYLYKLERKERNDRRKRGEPVDQD